MKSESGNLTRELITLVPVQKLEVLDLLVPVQNVEVVDLLVPVTLLGLALVLPPPVALEAEHMLPDWPALLPLHPRVQNHRAVLHIFVRVSIFWII